MQSCKKQINLGYRDVSMIWLGTHVIGAVVSGHAAALNGNKFRGCQPETVRKWVAEMSTNALSHNLRFKGECTMTVDKIIPCICIGSEPTVSDSVFYGMPILCPYNSNAEHKQYWDIKCPNCGRGGLFEEKSAYLALKKWNKMQESLRRLAGNN